MRRILIRFCDDISGVIMPYVALLMVALIAISALAIDIGRQFSLQTQMQAVADALALAGARELNQQAGAQGRATNAITNIVSNGLTGLGYSGAIAHTVAFYSALPAASSGFAGTATTSDVATKFVGVTVTPVTIDKTIQIVGTATLTAGGQAIAGFTAQAFCDIPPVFVCNPYETSGMSDSDATAALRTAVNDPSITRKLLRLDMSQTSPGHFGWLVPPDGCNGASCLKDWIAKTHPNTCYQTSSVDLNTGAKTNVLDGFNVRFDIYSPPLNYSANYAPSVNVRKGFTPGGGANKWCKAAPSLPYLSLPIVPMTGSTTKNSTSITGVNTTTGLINNNPIAGVPLPSNDAISTFATNTITLQTKASTTQSNAALTSKAATSGLPLDSNMTATTIFGNGNWNCADYWTVNHQNAVAPPGCTKSNPTISRYQVYRWEIGHNLIGDWSSGTDGAYAANVNGSSSTKNESGTPYCAGAGNGVDTSTGGNDRRTIPVAVINCLAQSGLISGGSTANNIPVAGFGKFFLTIPTGIATDPKIDSNSVYGEMTGLIGINDDVKILNQVQLYR
jgi:Flp pilus assembly protein TadG